MTTPLETHRQIAADARLDFKCGKLDADRTIKAQLSYIYALQDELARVKRSSSDIWELTLRQVMYSFLLPHPSEVGSNADLLKLFDDIAAVHITVEYRRNEPHLTRVAFALPGDDSPVWFDAKTVYWDMIDQISGYEAFQFTVVAITDEASRFKIVKRS